MGSFAKVTYHKDGTITIFGRRTSEPTFFDLNLICARDYRKVCKHCGLHPETGRKWSGSK